MKYLLSANKVDNEEGFVLVTALLVMIVLVAMGTMATNTTNIEKQIALNDRIEKQDFYDLETCLGRAKTTMTPNWFTDGFVTAGEDAGFPLPADVDVDGDGFKDLSEVPDPLDAARMIAAFEVRPVEISGTANLNLSSEANDFTRLEHIRLPYSGSGYDPKIFLIRRYVVTCRSADPNKNLILQEGIYKVFTNYN
ncbi:MAG: hypothetical protein KKB30_10030 [Proteobacteria bacterium]|nr:hypothetical protein [Pseudomonadota bacterium]MBU1716388.1 hypothetical protein [Pseudomonadota bacterium]